MLLAEPFLKKTGGKRGKEKLWDIPTSTLYRHLFELEKLGLYFKKEETPPEELFFYFGLLRAMQKRRVPGTPNPAGALHVLYDSFKLFGQKTQEGLELHKTMGTSLVLWLVNVLYRVPSAKILEIADKNLGSHSLRNVCITLLLLAQANPVAFESPKKKKTINFDRQLKRKGLYLGEASTEETYAKHFH